jgi:hypothetical protein
MSKENLEKYEKIDDFWDNFLSIPSYEEVIGYL